MEGGGSPPTLKVLLQNHSVSDRITGNETPNAFSPSVLLPHISSQEATLSVPGKALII